MRKKSWSPKSVCSYCCKGNQKKTAVWQPLARSRRALRQESSTVPNTGRQPPSPRLEVLVHGGALLGPQLVDGAVGIALENGGTQGERVERPALGLFAWASCALCLRRERVWTHHGAHETGQRERGVLARVHARLVQVADVHLDAGVILGRDQAVRPAALARDVQVNVLALIVHHF